MWYKSYLEWKGVVKKEEAACLVIVHCRMSTDNYLHSQEVILCFGVESFKIDYTHLNMILSIVPKIIYFILN